MMQMQQHTFKKKKLALAISVAMLSGMVAGCGSSSSGPVAGIFTILTSGGTGGNLDGGRGGDGGELTMENSGGTGGIELRATGEADASFTTPDAIKPAAVNLGTNPLTIAADTTIDTVADQVADGVGALAVDEIYVGTDDVLRSSVAGGVAVYATDPIVAAGTLYLTTNTSGIYTSSGDATADAVHTGLSVAAGVTLTLGDNNGASTRVEFANDIDNSGTITKVVNGNILTIDMGNYFATGDVSNAGTMTSMNAGEIEIDAVSSIVNSGMMNTSGYDNATGGGGDGAEIEMDAGGFVLNSGLLVSRGGNGMGAGGDGGRVDLDAAYVENTADIDTSGGDNTTDGVTLGDGGDGKEFDFDSDFGTNNSGNVNASGGDGSQGGRGGRVDIDTFDLGDVRNTGDLNASGGIGHTNSGRRGGRIDLAADGGSVISSGNLTSTGGDSLDPAGSDGGEGGNISLDTDDGIADTLPGDILLSGNLNSSGGNALATSDGQGGDGGELVIEADGGEGFGGGDQRIALLGYVSIDANGGDGGEFGGDGAEFSTVETRVRQNLATLEWTAGSIVNDVTFNARGGNATVTTADTGGAGGDGGEVSLEATQDDRIKALDITATNNANIDISGGTGVFSEVDGGPQSGGDGGEMVIFAYHNASNNGILTANGGDGGEFGGGGGELVIDSLAATASNKADVIVNGADGAERGGFGGFVFITGLGAVNSGNVNLNAGNATNPNGFFTGPLLGADGGEMVVLGQGLDAVNSNSGTVTFTFGTGITGEGEEGCLQVGLTFEGTCN